MSLGAAVLGLMAVLAQADPGVSVISEVGAGVAPVIPGETPRKGVAITVEPTADVRLGEGRVGRLVLSYTPRVTWRQPNANGTEKPLLLQTVAADGVVAPVRRLKLVLDARVSKGQPDYLALANIFGRTQAALPGASVRDILVLISTLDVIGSLTPRAALGLRTEASYRRTLNEIPPGPDATPEQLLAAAYLATQKAVSVQPYFAYQVDRRDILQLATNLSYEQRAPDYEFVVGFANLSWQHHVTRQQLLLLAGGMAYTKATGRNFDGSTIDRTLTSPIATIDYTGLLSRSTETAVRADIGLAIQSVVDPVLNTAGPRASARAYLAMAMAPAWEVAIEGDFSANLAKDPMFLAGTIPPDETVASATLRVRRLMSRYFALDARFRWSDRAPNLRNDTGSFHQRELWFSIAAIATSRPEGARSTL